MLVTTSILLIWLDLFFPVLAQMLFLGPEIDGDVCGGGETFKICRGSGIVVSTLVPKHICKAKILFSDLQVKTLKSYPLLTINMMFSYHIYIKY